MSGAGAASIVVWTLAIVLSILVGKSLSSIPSMSLSAWGTFSFGCSLAIAFYLVLGIHFVKVDVMNL